MSKEKLYSSGEIITCSKCNKKICEFSIDIYPTTPITIDNYNNFSDERLKFKKDDLVINYCSCGGSYVRFSNKYDKFFEYHIKNKGWK